MDLNIDQANYNYTIQLPTGENLYNFWLANASGKGANTETQGFDALAIYLAPYMPYYETITPGDQGL